MDILEELRWRGLIHQLTDDLQLRVWLQPGKRCVYAGFDPTADSLHVGHLMPLWLLRRFQQAGHRPIALVGGATGMIGDPSGRSAERNLLSRAQLEHNVRAIATQLGQFLDFDGPCAARLVNNFDWMKEIGYLDFLRDVGKAFPVNVMLAKDSVKGRLDGDAGLSYTEFSYMLLQAYDFVQLHRQADCRLQVGGSDQWGNITAGIDLGRRLQGVQLFGLTCPLLTKADGTKMGKTESGAVWLSPARTSPYAFYQYWYNVDDADAGRCLRFLTARDRSAIEALDAERQTRPEARATQAALAEDLTRLVHGADGLAVAERARDILFGGEITALTDDQLTQILADVPSHQLPRVRLESQDLSLLEAFVLTGLASSKGDARRTVSQGGAYVNNRRCLNVDELLTPQHLASETVMVLRSGRKNYALLRFLP